MSKEQGLVMHIICLFLCLVLNKPLEMGKGKLWSVLPTQRLKIVIDFYTVVAQLSQVLESSQVLENVCEFSKYSRCVVFYTKCVRGAWFSFMSKYKLKPGTAWSNVVEMLNIKLVN